MRRWLFALILMVVTIPASAQSFLQFKLGSDTSNTASGAMASTTAGSLMVSFAGTQLLAGTEGQASGTFTSATMSDGTLLSQCSNSACSETTSDGYLNTRIWLGTEGAGGTTPTFTHNTTSSGNTIGNMVYELGGVNAIDQIADTQYIGFGAGGGTISSPTITTTKANAVLLCLAQEAHPIAAGNHMVSIATAGWTGDAFGNQGLAHRVVSSTGSYSCTINLGAGVAEDYIIYIVAFYSSPPVSGGATYYLSCGSCSPAGNDSNSGLDTAHPWLTPNHAVNCGDYIIAAASSSYSSNSFNDNWGTVTCPAGNNVAWLKCTTFDACKMSCNGCGVLINQSYWGIQGFEATMPGPTYTSSCFLTAPDGSTTIHHIIFANNIANSCGESGVGSTSGGGGSVDYIAIIGNISYDAAHNGGSVCGQGLTVFGPKASDTNSGTHIFIAGNFSWKNVDNASCNSSAPSDGEGLELDTFNLNSYAQQTVVENNMFLYNGGRGLEALGTTGGTTYLKQNTIYGNNTDTHQSTCGELFFNNASGTVNNSGNLILTTAATCPQGATWYDIWLQNSSSGVAMTSAYAYSAAGNNCTSSGGSTGCGSLTFTTTNPVLSAPAVPPAPSCGSSTSVPNCMATVISNHAPTLAGALTYGYQAVSGTATYDPLFPQWLCNVNLPAGLVTSGCATSTPNIPTTLSIFVVGDD